MYTQLDGDFTWRESRLFSHTKLSYVGEHSVQRKALLCTICSREIFTKKCRQQQNFDSDPKEAWHYNHVIFTWSTKISCYDVDWSIRYQCYTLDLRSKGGDTRELQSMMVPWKNNWVEPPKVGQKSSFLKCLSPKMFYFPIWNYNLLK